MTPFYTDDAVTLFHGDCLEVLASLPDCSVDSVVTDPPYGLGFMGREWDDLPPGVEFAAECLRVLKPGGHMLAFGGSRTWHRLTCAIEDAGFEIRDSIAWLYGSGFPKSLDVSKAIDKAAGAEREVTGRTVTPFKVDAAASRGTSLEGSVNGDFSKQTDDGGYRYTEHTAPATPDAQRWQGWGTALKPAFEPIVVARKPLAGTVAANVLAYGTGALNVDGCRIQSGPSVGGSSSGRKGTRDDVGEFGYDATQIDRELVAGRWPSNVVLDESQAAELDRQSGTSRDGVAVNRNRAEGYGTYEASAYTFEPGKRPDQGYGGEGGASRFFPTFRYEPKAPTAERPRNDTTAHPTVKPLDLMRWLVRLVTPPGGTVLDPFAGSGTTAEACIVEGFNCIAIERETDYLPLIVARLTKPIQVALDFD